LPQPANGILSHQVLFLLMKMHAGYLHGQTTIDYVLVLSVVLMIGLIALGLSSAWPDFALNSRNQQAVTFWRDQARPITITEAHYDMSDNKLFFTMQTQIDERLELSGFYLDGLQMSVSAYDAGGSHTLMCNRASCPALGCVCDYPLYPRRKELAITEDIAAVGINTGCRQSGEISRLPLAMTYYRPADAARTLVQNATVELVFDCQP